MKRDPAELLRALHAAGKVHAEALLRETRWKNQGHKVTQQELAELLVAERDFNQLLDEAIDWANPETPS